ncbi:hypothetical protein SCL_1340 [Sulfuricaulis limicola]|uniref:Uncharacterized protein n=1 Tax=Sulfuricaulis limicola TaxID=1620215 RepID=A0A1B4XFR7_9GAMM|nr:hypothetical protein [Sulfuricaulis limicola]BAV33651.1 hypothetical protein SCL_1340 [Sulfuricaulis limicola]
MRIHIGQLRQDGRGDCRQRFGLKDFTELSVGMSGGHIEAIQEDAAMVRVGTAIYGERDYSEKQAGVIVSCVAKPVF